MSQCLKCGRELTNDEVGLHKKMVNRGAQKFMCIDCLASYYQVGRHNLEEKIKQFKEMGCTLFQQ